MQTWIKRALADLGVHETKGPKVTPAILEALDWADGGKDGHYLQGIHDDETPWCASWACGVLEQVGIKSPRSAWAQSFATWGQKLSFPALHSIVVFKWSPKAGHVGFIMGQTTSGALMVLGGNQSDAVNIKPFGRSQVLAYRWPLNHSLPVVRDLPVTSQDKIVSTLQSTR